MLESLIATSGTLAIFGFSLSMAVLFVRFSGSKEKA